MVLRFWTALLTIALFLGVSGEVRAQEKIERYNKGQINWTSRQLLLKAKAAPYPDAADSAEARLGAELAAKQVLWHNYIDMLVNIRFNANQNTHHFLESQPALKSRMRAILRNYRQSGRQFFKDDSVEVSSYLSLDEIFAQVLYSDLRGPLNGPLPEPLEPFTPGPNSPSGVVIDCRGTGLRPALLPKLRSENEVIWDTAQATTLWQGGPLIYATDTGPAVTARAGTRPLQIQALKNYGNYPVDVVLSTADGQKLAANIITSLLKAGRLVLLVD